ncbi:hypothetical protein [Flavobacterium ovatum]|uniref:acyltransferase n=1 Tax=Flavobacterium ovatum TaxID=1928857 RepID=UPI00344EB5E2
MKTKTEAKVIESQRIYFYSNSNESNSTDIFFISGNFVIKYFFLCSAEAFIMTNITLGEGAIIVERSAVFKDVAAWTIVGGNPAKFIKDRKIE